MTPEKAIETIKTAITEVEWEYPMDYAVAFEMAIKALEKQIPKKVVDDYYCPCCGTDALNQCDNDYMFEHCYHCGQAIDWS